MRQYCCLGVLSALAWCAAIGCGGGAGATETATRDDSTVGDERPAEEVDDGSITGIMGTIRTDQVNDTLQPRMSSFERCLVQRMSAVEFLGGDVRFSFRIRTDGTVLWVYLSQSTLGDRQAERCLLESAARAHFPHPHGGEAEFGWGFGFDPPEEVRAPLAWDATRVGPALLEGAPGLASRCGASGLRVTAYVAPGGRVISAGASTPDAQAAATAVDCVVDAVRGLTMPDPGSYAAKVTFLVQ